MKARLSLDQFADASKCNEAQQKLLSFKAGRNAAGKTVPVPYFPAGSVFEGDQAIALCRTGQAVPADDECAEALGLSEEKIAALQVDYKMTSLGINDKGDRELYRAGVIAGYKKVGDKVEVIHGPNWKAYQAAIAEAEELDDELDDDDDEEEGGDDE
jgi:hypothetical protein